MQDHLIISLFILKLYSIHPHVYACTQTAFIYKSFIFLISNQIELHFLDFENFKNKKFQVEEVWKTNRNDFEAINAISV